MAILRVGRCFRLASDENVVALVLFHCTNHKFVSISVTKMPQMRYPSDCNHDTIVCRQSAGTVRHWARRAPGALFDRRLQKGRPSSPRWILAARCESFARDCSGTLAFRRRRLVEQMEREIELVLRAPFGAKLEIQTATLPKRSVTAFCNPMRWLTAHSRDSRLTFGSSR
jgi:hypothetical protein